MIDYLIVSFSTLPLARPRSYQIAKLLKYLKGSYFILTSDCAQARGLDDSLNRYAGYTDDNVHRVKDLSGGKVVKTIFEICSVLNHLPDNHWLWGYSVASLAKKMKKKLSPKIIIAFSRPETDLLVGVKLKKIFDVPLVVHFSDPWVDNPYKNYNFLERWVNKKLESKVMKNADLIFFTNKDQKNLVMQKYPENIQKKSKTIPHCYDEALYDCSMNNNTERFVIRHIGNLYGQRSPAPFFKALSSMVEEYPELKNKIIVEFFGQVGKETVKAISLYSLEQIVHIRQSVLYKKSLELMSDADLLLTIDAESEHNLFFPSKLADYIGAKKNILAITAAKGPTAIIVKKYGGKVFAHNDIEEIKNFLVLTITNQLEFTPDNAEYCRYNAKSVAYDFESMLREVIEQKL